MIEEVKAGKTLLAIILPYRFRTSGIKFLTPNSFSQQLAYMHHPKGKVIPAHVHNPVFRSMKKTLEVLFIKSGKVRIDFYTNRRRYVESRMLSKGDIILLANGGHGFTMASDAEIVEVKQGPYVSDKDKTRFEGVNTASVHIK
jgi:hypothetical protein